MSWKVLEFFKISLHSISGLVLLLLLFLKAAVGLHCTLPLLLHYPLSGHRGLVCGGHGVAKERVEEQFPGFLLEDRGREGRTRDETLAQPTTCWHGQHGQNSSAAYRRFDLSFLGFGVQRGRSHCNFTKGNVLYKNKSKTHNIHLKFLLSQIPMHLIPVWSLWKPQLVIYPRYGGYRSLWIPII